ncbi:hypothetical protein B7494_g3213 [Chlorociboria aeruginascens]|nr:hypothetical protein B7494_g3213 [Chlorociboria aeruginascens]
MAHRNSKSYLRNSHQTIVTTPLLQHPTITLFGTPDTATPSTPHPNYLEKSPCSFRALAWPAPPQNPTANTWVDVPVIYGDKYALYLAEAHANLMRGGVPRKIYDPAKRGESGVRCKDEDIELWRREMEEKFWEGEVGVALIEEFESWKKLNMGRNDLVLL